MGDEIDLDRGAQCARLGWLTDIEFEQALAHPWKDNRPTGVEAMDDDRAPGDSQSDRFSRRVLERAKPEGTTVAAGRVMGVASPCDGAQRRKSDQQERPARSAGGAREC